MVDNREKGLFNSGTEHNILFVMDFGIRNEHGQPVYTIMGLYPDPEITLEEALTATSRGRYPSYHEMLANVLRLCVTIGFLSDNPTICEEDVLSKDRSEFEKTTDENRKKQLIARAQRKGKVGYNIGNDLIFLAGARPKGERRQGTLTGRELDYAHIRGGHPHAVRYGSNKDLVKIMWFIPTTVREDLPFKPD